MKQAVASASNPDIGSCVDSSVSAEAASVAICSLLRLVQTEGYFSHGVSSTHKFVSGCLAAAQLEGSEQLRADYAPTARCITQ